MALSISMAALIEAMATSSMESSGSRVVRRCSAIPGADSHLTIVDGLGLPASFSSS